MSGTAASHMQYHQTGTYNYQNNKLTDQLSFKHAVCISYLCKIGCVCRFRR